MSTLNLHLREAGQLKTTLSLPARSTIETTLTVTPNRVNLPTLISVENIVEQINEHGFELIDSSEIDKIASLLHHKYLPIPIQSWKDADLDLQVGRISLSAEQYSEIGNIRGSVRKAARDVAHHETKGELVSSKQAQDAALMEIARSVEKKPSWWERNRGKLLEFASRTAIEILFDTLFGIPLATFIRSVLK